MGSGLRLLPLIGGLIAGAVPADRVVRIVGAKFSAAGGFLLLGVGLAAGSTTSLQSTVAFVGVDGSSWGRDGAGYGDHGLGSAI